MVLPSVLNCLQMLIAAGENYQILVRQGQSLLLLAVELTWRILKAFEPPLNGGFRDLPLFKSKRCRKAGRKGRFPCFDLHQRCVLAPDVDDAGRFVGRRHRFVEAKESLRGTRYIVDIVEVEPDPCEALADDMRLAVG